jgi:hypothetical protein
LGEELALPKLNRADKKPSNLKLINTPRIASEGPNSLRHFKRTFKEALKRQMASGVYDPDNPIIIPIKKDMRYRSWKSDINHENSAVIIYMMDVSGSMGDEQKEIVRTEAFWINTWLRNRSTKALKPVTSFTMPPPKKSMKILFLEPAKVEVRSFLPLINLCESDHQSRLSADGLEYLSVSFFRW